MLDTLLWSRGQSSVLKAFILQWKGKGEGGRTRSSTLLRGAGPSLLSSRRKVILTQGFRHGRFSARMYTSQASTVTTHPLRSISHVPRLFSIPQGLSCFPRSTALGAFPLFGKRIGSCVDSPQDLWRGCLGNRYQLWEAELLGASARNVRVNFLCGSALLHTASAAKRLPTRGTQPGQGRCVRLRGFRERCVR